MRRMAEKFRRRKVLWCWRSAKSSKLSGLSMMEHHIGYLSGTSYKCVLFQACLLCIWTCSLHSLDAFDRCMKRVRTKSHTRSNEKSKRVWTKSQKGSNEKPNTSKPDAKHVRMSNQPLSLKVWNVLKQDSKHLLITSETHSKLSTDSVN